MKVIGVDNHDRDDVSDVVAAEGLTQEEAQKLCTKLNKGLGDGPGTYYQVKPDDYKVYIFKGY